MNLRRNKQFKEIFIIAEGQLVSQPAAKKNKFIEINTYNTHGAQALDVHTLIYSDCQWHREQTKVFLFIFDGFSCFIHYSTLSISDIFFSSWVFRFMVSKKNNFTAASKLFWLSAARFCMFREHSTYQISVY